MRMLKFSRRDGIRYEDTQIQPDEALRLALELDPELQHHSAMHWSEDDDSDEWFWRVSEWAYSKADMMEEAADEWDARKKPRKGRFVVLHNGKQKNMGGGRYGRFEKKWRGRAPRYSLGDYRNQFLGTVDDVYEHDEVQAQQSKDDDERVSLLHDKQGQLQGASCKRAGRSSFCVGSKTLKSLSNRRRNKLRRKRLAHKNHQRDWLRMEQSAAARLQASTRFGIARLHLLERDSALGSFYTEEKRNLKVRFGLKHEPKCNRKKLRKLLRGEF